MTIVSVWGYPSNPFYNPEKANNGGGYWQYYGGVALDLHGELVVVELQDDDCGDFGARWSFDVDAPGYWWHANCGNAADASIDALEDIDAVCASIEGVLGIDIMAVIGEIAPVIDECARRQWQALNKGA